ncbi:LOW QUALITY PROTEIN: spermatogenesis-associated protein 1 [Dermochelys coriacea]|uniref:LOW QUALITY PROTEIN: spermatogenesis-associated protein 1 n=1 Tax=Dermochelys coriacea TaxID=27794 RepID=UPI001CA9E450|nr:LOW QUALITY PROTEIN: spermatogenesis-associated protein 1 [Dermochelys coriacea]
MSFSQTRPPTSELVELHVFYVPEEVWNFTLNTVSAALTSKFISAGFIRVPRHVTLRALREQLGDFLGEDAVADKFIFLKHIGKKASSGEGKTRNRTETQVICSPTCTSSRIIFASWSGPLRNCLFIINNSRYTALNVESHRSPHGPSTLNLPKKKPEKSPTFLEGPLKHTLRQNQEDSNSLGWSETEKEMIPVLHIKPEQSLNNRTQEKKIPYRRKDQIESNGSLHIPSGLNPTKWESGKNPTSLESAQKNHLSQDQKESNTLSWSQKDKGTLSGHHVKQSIEQAKNNETQENHIPPGRKEEISIVMGENVENRCNLKAIRMGRNTTGDSEIPESLEDGDKEYLHSKKRPQQSGIRESVADIGIKQDDKTDKNNVNHLEYSSQYISPPPPPALSINRAQVPIFQTEKSKMVEQLKQMKAERRHMERTREELVKKVKSLLEQNKLRRYHARDAWKKKYFETKKATTSLEDILNKLRQDLELYYQKLLLQLEARDIRKQPNNLTHIANAKNTTIIQITTVQHEIDQLKRKLDNTKMKLIIEIKMRKQAASDLRALRAELAQKKIQSSLILQSETPIF